MVSGLPAASSPNLIYLREKEIPGNSKHNSRKANNNIRKWARDMDRHFSAQDIQIVANT